MSNSSPSVSAQVRERPPLAEADLPAVDGAAYHRLRWFALALVCAASFMEILDAQIVTVAIPSIERSLGLSAGHVQWLLSGYTVAFGGLLLVGGRAADLFGRRRMFIIGVGGFTLFSLLKRPGVDWFGADRGSSRAGRVRGGNGARRDGDPG